jgi:hypothetical protein
MDTDMDTDQKEGRKEGRKIKHKPLYPLQCFLSNFQKKKKPPPFNYYNYKYNSSYLIFIKEYEFSIFFVFFQEEFWEIWEFSE